MTSTSSSSTSFSSAPIVMVTVTKAGTWAIGLDDGEIFIVSIESVIANPSSWLTGEMALWSTHDVKQAQRAIERIERRADRPAGQIGFYRVQEAVKAQA